jgi:hypothetical protein
MQKQKHKLPKRIIDTNKLQDGVYEIMKDIPKIDTRNMDFEIAKLENISNLTRHLLSLPEFSEEECGKMLDEIEKNRAK